METSELMENFAVARIHNNEIVAIGPKEFCDRYSKRSNEHLAESLRVHVIPYTGKSFIPRHSPPFHNGLEIHNKIQIPDVESAKDKVRKYLKKIS